MRAALQVVTALGVVAFAGGRRATAQHPVTREGFWGAIGFGYGHNSLTASNNFAFADSAQGGGVALFFKAGSTVSPSLRVGGEGNLWLKDVSGLTETVGNVSAALYFYPAPRSGLFLKGGVGLASYQLSEGNASSTTTGFGLLAGLGYDIHLGGKVSLTPVANFYWGHDGDMSPATGIQHKIYDFGLGIQYN